MPAAPDPSEIVFSLSAKPGCSRSQAAPFLGHLSRPDRYAGQDSRLSDRARGDRGRPAAAAADRAGRRQSLRGGAGRGGHRGVLHPQAGRARGLDQRNVGDPAQEPATLHGSGISRRAGRDPDDVEQQGGPQESAGAQRIASHRLEQQICRSDHRKPSRRSPERLPRS